LVNVTSTITSSTATAPPAVRASRPMGAVSTTPTLAMMRPAALNHGRVGSQLGSSSSSRPRPSSPSAASQAATSMVGGCQDSTVTACFGGSMDIQ
jgi:hypothetical protein